MYAPTMADEGLRRLWKRGGPLPEARGSASHLVTLTPRQQQGYLVSKKTLAEPLLFFAEFFGTACYRSLSRRFALLSAVSGSLRANSPFSPIPPSSSVTQQSVALPTVRPNPPHRLAPRASAHWHPRHLGRFLYQPADPAVFGLRRISSCYPRFPPFADGQNSNPDIAA